MRLLRGNRVPVVLDQYDYHFEIGKAKLLRDGGDVLVISCGEMTMRALDAAEDLEKEGIHVAVLHSPPSSLWTVRLSSPRFRRSPAGWLLPPRTTRLWAVWAVWLQTCWWTIRCPQR